MYGEKSLWAGCYPYIAAVGVGETGSIFRPSTTLSGDHYVTHIGATPTPINLIGLI
jgi:hypothetical protein